VFADALDPRPRPLAVEPKVQSLSCFGIPCPIARDGACIDAQIRPGDHRGVVRRKKNCGTAVIARTRKTLHRYSRAKAGTARGQVLGAGDSAPPSRVAGGSGRFAADSALEGRGFEPSVPCPKHNAFRDSPVQLDPSRAAVPWDAIYASQARDCGFLLACQGDFP
jgi:hypothetical protein